MVGGGVAAFDCDGDGYLDLLLPGGSSPAQLYRNTSSRGGPLTFEKVPSALELVDVSGAYPADIDSDGITDLIVIRVGENVAMRGLGECRFERANEAWGFDGGDAWSTALAVTWEHGADWPTVAVGNYIDREEEISPWGSCTDNWLHRPGEPGKFASPLPLKPSFCALSMLFTDWNRSGTPSLRIANDREYYEGGEEQLWQLPVGGEPEALHRRRRLEAAAHLGHGHRQHRPRWRRLPGILPHQHGRQQAADAHHAGRPMPSLTTRTSPTQRG
jgi:hypothetical protein